MAIKAVRAKWYQKVVLNIAASRAGSWLLSRGLSRLDRMVLALTRGRRSLTAMATGLPVIDLTTFGARSGQPRICPLIAIPDGDKFVVIASNFGSRKHPSWYYNLRANPEVIVRINAAQKSFIASTVDGDDREKYWRQAVAMYHGYREYNARAAGRKIPIVLLEPLDPG